MATADVTGSAPDVIAAALGISEALRAGKGFVFNSCVFAIAIGEKTGSAPPTGPGPAASPTATSQQPAATTASQQPAPAATARRPATITQRVGPTLLEVSSGAVGEDRGPSTVVRLGLRQITGPDYVIGIAELQYLDEAFDAGGDSIAVELFVPEVAPAPGTALLAIKGFANPGGLGYAHVEAAILVSIGSGAEPSLRTRALFASQAPPPQRGTGIFGKTVFVDALSDRIRIQMERRPLFDR